MTYNVFSGTLNPTQSINPAGEHELGIGTFLRSDQGVHFCCVVGSLWCCSNQRENASLGCSWRMPLV